jgi:hypothetical protein
MSSKTDADGSRTARIALPDGIAITVDGVS